MRSPAQEKKPASARAAQKPKTGGGRPGPGPTFVSKLYKMLSDTGNARLITWTPAGDAFVVLRPSEFARKLLPTQYKHSQFQSFVRQANMYGFSKVTLPSALLTQLLAQPWAFKHPKFMRGAVDLLPEVRRKA
ncbi:HSF-type DNA-binding-domain-containing protein, partial [Catenaria anguillulae PL171]